MKRPFKQHRPLFSNTVPKSVRDPKIEWKVLPILWLALKRMAMFFGFIFIINMVFLMMIAGSFQAKDVAPIMPDDVVLYLELEDGLQELPAHVSFADPFAGKSLTLSQMVDALDRAAVDGRVKGLVARMNDGGFSVAQATELRAALKRFRAAGKFAHIYSSSYGDGGGGLGRYYLASAFDQIWMQPLGIVSIPGINAEMPFMREALDKLGIQPQFFKRKDYKTAYENLTNKSISPENRAMTAQLVRDLRTALVADISADRGITPAQFEALVDEGLFTADAAVKAGLITHADYADVLLDDIAEQVIGVRDYEELELMPIKNYAKQTAPKGSGAFGGGKSKVALVYAVGAIMPSADGGGPMGANDGIAAADEIAPAILDAVKDDKVRAIVVRIDSPGGSPTASESILRSVEKAKDAGKPVIVSMGSTAASGGYWIAAFGDRIFAQPATITGSIGVIGGKFSLEELLGKIGVDFDGVSWGKNSGMWSIDTPFSESEAKQINAMLDNVYEQFIARVAKGRGMSEAEVDKIAGGRVWTGARAQEIGLVDELGGLTEALDYTAQQLGLKTRKDLQVVVMPKPKTALEQFAELLEGQVMLQDQLRDVVAPISRMMNIQSQNPQDFMTYEPLRLK